MLLDIFEVCLIFIAPIALIYYKMIPFSLRLWTLGIFFSFSILIILQERWPLKTLGIRLDNIKSALAPYAIFVIMGLAFLFWLSRFISYGLPAQWWRETHFFLFIPVSIAQEVLYRGFLFPRLATIIASAPIIIVVNATLFAFLHIIYPHKKFNLLLGFISGIGFAFIYYLFPNLILISLAHIILNFTAIVLGFFTLTTTEATVANGKFKNRVARDIFLKLYTD